MTPIILEIKPKDYSKSVVYKIICKDELVEFIYVGSTRSWQQRYSQHKSDCNNGKSPRHNLQIYEFMRNNGGWENFVMILVEELCCENKRELNKREQYWKDKCEDNIGFKRAFNRAFLSPEQNKEANKKYYQANKEEIKKQKREQYAVDKSYRQKYYQEHKEQILLKAKEAYANKLKVKHGLN
jgi:hypothetical protein